MMGTTHMMGAMAAVAALSRVGILPDHVYLVLPAMVGGLLPDIDHAGSYISHKVSFKVRLPFPGKWHIELNPIYWVLANCTEHRKETHSLGAIILLCIISILAGLALIMYVPMVLFITFLIGYASHIGLDLLTKEGAALFWPLSEQKVSLLSLTTGGLFERLLAVLFLVLIGGLYWNKAIWMFKRLWA